VDYARSNIEGEANMNASTVHRIISMIPERVACTQSGALFTTTGACRHPERIAYLSRCLQWLSPLNPVSRDDQQLLGLLLANGRTVHAGDLEDEADAAPAFDDLDIPVVLLDDEPVEEEQNAAL
jgi:hypothetical protein